MRDDMYLTEMGKRIRAIRKSQNVSLQKLGVRCNMFYSVICQIENGNRNCHILILKTIADALNVDVKDFI